jgi:nucleotide-binding universal stress UspA family protein
MTTFDKENTAMLDLIMPKRILVATDLNDSEFLIPHAIVQAKASGAMVTLVHAIQPFEMVSPGFVSHDFVDRDKIEVDTEVEMLSLAEKIEASGVSCDVVAKRGFAVDVVQDQIKATQATRLIMASHGRGKWGQLMMGSVANQLLGNVQIPVFVVGPKSAHLPTHASPRKILHPVSLDGNYRNSIELAVALAQKFGAELTLLHVPDRDLEASFRPGCTHCWAKSLFAELFPKDASLVQSVKVEVAFGNLADEIRKAAGRVDADWIVMGAEQGLPLWPIVECSAYKVVANANCPVFVFQSSPLRVQEEKTNLVHCIVGCA